MLFNLLSFLSAFLLFAQELVISQELLPLFGGSYLVWLVSVFFYTCVLFLGYLSASASPRLGRVWPIVHFILLLAALLKAWLPSAHAPGATLLGLLFSKAFLTLFCLSLTSPLLQILKDSHGQKLNFQLYAYSNVGSALALLFFPLAIHPFVPHSKIVLALQIGFGLYCVGMLFILSRSLNFFTQTEKKQYSLIPPNLKDALLWMSLPALSTMLYLSVTNFISQRVGNLPFIWTFPLFCYLYSFVITFRESPYPQRFMTILLFGWVGLFVGNLVVPDKPLLEAASYILFTFISCSIIHQQLYQKRPLQADKVGPFYVMLNLGGVLGTVLVAFIIPQLPWQSGNSLLELDLAITGLFLFFVLRDIVGQVQKLRELFSQKILRKLAPLVLVSGVVLLGKLQTESVPLLTMRNFYGINKIIIDTDGRKMLINGRTVHGGEFTDDKRKGLPIAYHHTKAPFGELMALTESLLPRQKVAMVGLGMGAMLYYSRPGDQWDLYELDPDLVELAKNNFTFLKNSPAELHYVIGDARLKLQESNSFYDLIIMDAFGSAAVPFHLLTKEAIDLYRQRLTPRGAIVFNISNPFFDLAAVLSAYADQAGLWHVIKEANFKDEHGPSSSRWLLMGHLPATRETLLQQSWSTQQGLKVLWTDELTPFWPPILSKF